MDKKVLKRSEERSQEKSKKEKDGKISRAELKAHSRKQQKCHKNGFLRHRRRMENKKGKSLKNGNKKERRK